MGEGEQGGRAAGRLAAGDLRSGGLGRAGGRVWCLPTVVNLHCVMLVHGLEGKEGGGEGAGVGGGLGWHRWHPAGADQAWPGRAPCPVPTCQMYLGWVGGGGVDFGEGRFRPNGNGGRGGGGHPPGRPATQDWHQTTGKQVWVMDARACVQPCMSPGGGYRGY